MDKKGLTLIELVMVLAVIAIIGAILVPTFLSTTDKARLKGDVQSAKVIQNAMDLYQAEHGVAVPGNTMQQILEKLAETGYLREGQISIQTALAVWEKNADMGVVVNINGCDRNSVRIKAFNQLSDQEKPYVTNGINETP